MANPVRAEFGNRCGRSCSPAKSLMSWRLPLPAGEVCKTFAFLIAPGRVPLGLPHKETFAGRTARAHKWRLMVHAAQSAQPELATEQTLADQVQLPRDAFLKGYRWMLSRAFWTKRWRACIDREDPWRCVPWPRPGSPRVPIGQQLRPGDVFAPLIEIWPDAWPLASRC